MTCKREVAAVPLLPNADSRSACMRQLSFLTSAGSGAMLMRLMEDGRAVTYARSLNGGG